MQRLSVGTSLKSIDLPKASRKLQLGDLAELNVGLDCAFGIATRYWLDGPAIESRWGVRFSTLQPSLLPT
jgi:hypothetical protein